MDVDNTEGAENFPNLPQTSKLETVIINETDSFPSRNLTVMQVAGVSDPVSTEDVNVVVENAGVASQKCLLLRSDKKKCSFVKVYS